MLPLTIMTLNSPLPQKTNYYVCNYYDAEDRHANSDYCVVTWNMRNNSLCKMNWAIIHIWKLITI